MNKKCGLVIPGMEINEARAIEKFLLKRFDLKCLIRHGLIEQYLKEVN